MFDVAQVAGFDDGVHVAEREGDEGRGDAFSLVEDDVGVGAGEAGRGLVLEGDFGFFGDGHESFGDFGVVGAAMGEAGAGGEFDFAMFAVVHVGGVSGVGDVENDGDGRHEAMGDHARAVAADFLLDGVDADDSRRGAGFGFGEAGEDLGDDVAADAVVEGAAHETVFAEGFDAIGIDERVADTDPGFFDFGIGGGTDIDPEFVDFGDFFVFAVANVDGDVPDDATDRAFVTEDIDAAATRGGDIGTSDSIDKKEAVF